MKHQQLRRWSWRIGIAIGAIICLACLVFLALYFLPTRQAELQSAKVKDLSYEQAVKQAESTTKSDKKHTKLTKGCESKLYSHGKKTAKSIVMFHGVTSCPSEFSALAKTFFDAGYNVYVPLAPHQGTTDAQQTVAEVTTSQLATYTKESYAIGAGIGKSVGLVGISGGATLATWGAQQLDVTNLLVLSPFYGVAREHMSAWQKPFLYSLYGRNLIPDQHVEGFSLRAISKYLLFTENFPDASRNPKLKHVAVVTSAGDTLINLDTAHLTAQKLAKQHKASFQQTRLAPELGLTHDIVSPAAKPVAANQAQLNNLYLSFYENRPPAAEL